jgi:hypothetical protein
MYQVKKRKKKLQRYQGKQQKNPNFLELLLNIANYCAFGKTKLGFPSPNFNNIFQVKCNHVKALVKKVKVPM